MENSDQTPTARYSPRSPFPATRDSLIHRLTGPDPAQARLALTALCEIYRDPIFYWLRRQGMACDHAEDLAQSFMGFLLEKNHFEDYIRGAARFRSFLLECLKRFRLHQRRKEHAAKRGGGVEPAPLDEEEAGIEVGMDKTLDRKIAWEVHRQALAGLEMKYEKLGRLDRVRELRRFILGGDETVSYAEVGDRLGIRPNAVKKAVHDLRDVYFEFFQREVERITPPEMLHEEMRYLIALLGEPDAEGAGLNAASP